MNLISAEDLAYSSSALDWTETADMQLLFRANTSWILELFNKFLQLKSHKYLKLFPKPAW